MNYIFWYPFTPEVRALLSQRWLHVGRLRFGKLEPANSLNFFCLLLGQDASFAFRFALRFGPA